MNQSIRNSAKTTGLRELKFAIWLLQFVSERHNV